MGRRQVGRWTKEETELLEDLVEQIGAGNWVYLKTRSYTALTFAKVDILAAGAKVFHPRRSNVDLKVRGKFECLNMGMLTHPGQVSWHTAAKGTSCGQKEKRRVEQGREEYESKATEDQ